MTASSGVLYTPEILGLAVSLAAFPYDDNASLKGSERSRTCGSRIAFSCEAAADGAIESPGIAVSACAIGQAAAAIFVTDAAGRTPADLLRALKSIERWLRHPDAATVTPPDLPGLQVLAPAAAFPARHDAIILPWRAGLAALSIIGAAG
ncbi:iron-sulfur cluster assembly scaffold protein [Alteripontixanthobacter maritimus]|uniref:iron-sulfur cluster assembly scaffold protein n=1 Tax=Alteripontixanthobacter maritimus TaxID=2161824 RepID=UPI001E475A75|nr:iron-sulfur cluster assembly scaffold protein [Alteripontixanthobacter maritimus]